jgi:hypothetical protein
MADTGFKLIGTVESAGAWTAFSTIRLNTSDNSRSQAEGLTYIAGEVSDFTFGIPAGATIDGIEVQAEFRGRLKSLKRPDASASV